MKIKLIYTQIFILILFTGQNLCSQQSASSNHLYYTGKNVNSDISMNLLKIPATSTPIYNSTMRWNIGQEGGGYCDIEDHPGEKTFIVSNKIGSYTTLSINDFIVLPDIIIYPNPANSFFNIKIIGGKGKHLHYSLFDIIGRLIAQNSAENIEQSPFEQKINVESLPAGNYILRLQLNDQIITKKVIVQKKNNPI